MSNRANKSQSSHPAINLVAGGTAGLFEALCCHPLDTIKVRMQIQSRTSSTGKAVGFLSTGRDIVHNEGFLAFYKGLGAVVIGIIPKMAIRFTSYEFYRTLLADRATGEVSTGNTFLAGVGAGITEAVMVVNPMEVVKIRLQAQHVKYVPLVAEMAGATGPGGATGPTTATFSSAAYHAGQTGATSATTNVRAAGRYRNAIQATYVIVKEEGPRALYRGVSLTAARQASNQGANFTVYSTLKRRLQRYHNTEMLPSWETSLIGLISGAVGPFTNAPLDTIKTRLQKEKSTAKTSSFTKIVAITRQLIQEEGFRALYKGITPRVMRVAPGQAVTFTVYELIRKQLESMRA
ncbi:LAME_0H10484g1_1 [Lachancea meyersii CBS 8951]|uniref:LAME_0H10484g1_1 n=1 Tax=Lachancea meyersii CBS 8951 TaxID=1266667 RepID=A0A1G4KG32_9SACH|nr:LAME_0H10484g1_1 [Lachancea meyersii CBS 8951]